MLCGLVDEYRGLVKFTVLGRYLGAVFIRVIGTGGGGGEAFLLSSLGAKIFVFLKPRKWDQAER
jgi:hypothetical protein